MLQSESTTGPVGLSQWKIPTPIGNRTRELQLVAQCVHQLRYPVPPLSKEHKLNNTMAEKMEETIQWSESLNVMNWETEPDKPDTGQRLLCSGPNGDKWPVSGLLHAALPRLQYSTAMCLYRYWEVVETMYASYKNQYFVSCLLSSGRPVVAWRTPVHLFSCSPAHNQQARPAALSTGATQSFQQAPHWLFNILGRKLTWITLHVPVRTAQ